jgi:transaldolase
MARLEQLFDEFGQSPWLDNLTRGYLRDGTLARMAASGIRGVTANPTTFARAIEGSEDYDDQFRSLIGAGSTVRDAYWELVIADVEDACAVLRPTFDASEGTDGFVSLEVAPELARDAHATVKAARDLHRRIALPNVFVKVPATTQCIPAIRTLTAEGHSINITLIFSLSRYAEVIDAYLDGIEMLSANGGDPASVRSVASFFISRVDTEVDQRIDTISGLQDGDLRGRAAVAQAKLAYEMFGQRFGGDRWDRLVDLGAHLQRPLWASTSTKNAAYSDTLYVDSLIGPDTVNTLPESSIAAFEDHGRLARTIDSDVEDAHEVMRRFHAAGINMDDVGLTLEVQGVASFHQSFQEVLGELSTKARRLAIR